MYHFGYPFEFSQNPYTESNEFHYELTRAANQFISKTRGLTLSYNRCRGTSRCSFKSRLNWRLNSGWFCPLGDGAQFVTVQRDAGSNECRGEVLETESYLFHRLGRTEKVIFFSFMYPFIKICLGLKHTLALG